MNVSFHLFRLYNQLQGVLFPDLAAKRASELFLTPRRQSPKAWEVEMEKQGTRLSLDNGLSVLRWGNGSRRALLVHGWESRATQMGPLAEALQRSGYQVFAVDAPAHGLSKGTLSHPLAFTEAILNVGENLGPFDLVVGHSMGAAAVGFALSRGFYSRSAILIAPPADVLSVMQRFCLFIGLPKGAVTRFVAHIERVVNSPSSALDLNKLGHRIHCPILLIHDRNDIEIPFSDSEDLAKQWPTARLIATNGYGHRRILRSMEVLTWITRFGS